MKAIHASPWVVAQAIAAIPAEDRASAFEAAERCYLQTAKNLGGADMFAQKWALAVTSQIRAEVEQRVSANRKLLMALHEELVRAGSPDAQEFREVRQRSWGGARSSGSRVEVVKATRKLRFSIKAAVVPMFGLIPFPANRLADRTVAEEKRSPAPRKKGRKRIEGQREMLLLIPGEKAKETTSETIARTGIRQKKSG